MSSSVSSTSTTRHGCCLITILFPLASKCLPKIKDRSISKAYENILKGVDESLKKFGVGQPVSPLRRWHTTADSIARRRLHRSVPHPRSLPRQTIPSDLLQSSTSSSEGWKDSLRRGLQLVRTFSSDAPPPPVTLIVVTVAT